MHFDCLVVDDEEALGRSVCEYFNLFEVKTEWVPGSKECAAFLKGNSTDLILLDVNLDGESGFNLCKELREKSDLPILFISARSSDDDVLLGLGLGGDDYIAKPFSLNVLLAKTQALLRRYRRDGVDNAPDSETCSFGRYTLNQARMCLEEGDKEIELKSMEYKLLTYLVQNKNRTVPKNELFRRVWGASVTSDATLNVHIHRLREKIEDDPNNPRYIKTMWGVGYRLEAPDA